MKAVCPKCGREVKLEELYEMLIISGGHILCSRGKRDCKECRETSKRGSSIDTSIF